MKSGKITDGSAERLGAVAVDGGVNFAVFSAHATAIDLCLFDGEVERRLPLPARTGDIWHGFVKGIGPGQAYGFRAHGPWAPHEGHLFNPAKLLIDPYARALDRRLQWHPSMTGHDGPSPFTSGPSAQDSAPHVSKSVVVADRPAAVERPGRPGLIYEAHAKGLTMLHPDVPEAARGTWDGLTDPAIIAHMKDLGVTHLELLPVAAFIDDRHVMERGLVNYWGYQPIAQFAPEPRYQGAGSGFAEMVARLKAEGIGVILDVVYNHSGEGDAAGPTVCFKGLDNKSYYRLRHDGNNVNDTGTGNTLNVTHPMVTRLVLDALRHWADLGVAGFRFDLAVTLLRGESQFLDGLLADPVLKDLILIAEPWDLGPDGYRLGRFPPPFLEWNDRYRDDLRRFWRGDGRQGDLARRLAGSAELFDRYGRTAAASVNFLAAHDGFTLQDVVSYIEKHNLANGEANHDGHHNNLSDNFGVEGLTKDAMVVELRAVRKRAMLATLFLSQGTPMLLAGDEFGRSQQGNNNAYAQDNAVSWVDWSRANLTLNGFVARLSALRQQFPALRLQRFLHGDFGPDGSSDLVWRLGDGREPQWSDWDAPGGWPICCEIRDFSPGASGEALYLVFNSGPEVNILLPEGLWLWQLDSAIPDRPRRVVTGRQRIPGQSVQLFSQAGPAGTRR